jgi:LmbE family N-acetylglucosaminyl deacetylase
MNNPRAGAGVRVAVVAAHPDDEVLGCGATVARHAIAGDTVHVLILSEGATSRFDRCERGLAAAEISELARSARAANDILGSTDVQLLDFPDNRMDGVELLDVVKVIETFFARIQPQMIYTHFDNDLNVDHRIVSEAVQTACRPLPGNAVERILYFEVASSTEWQIRDQRAGFVPNYFVDVTATLDLKLQALAAYGSELRAWPHPRSVEGIEHLARWRGATVGCQAAEAFMLGRCILR